MSPYVDVHKGANDSEGDISVVVEAETSEWAKVRSPSEPVAVKDVDHLAGVLEVVQKSTYPLLDNLFPLAQLNERRIVPAITLPQHVVPVSEKNGGRRTAPKRVAREGGRSLDGLVKINARRETTDPNIGRALQVVAVAVAPVPKSLEKRGRSSGPNVTGDGRARTNHVEDVVVHAQGGGPKVLGRARGLGLARGDNLGTDDEPKLGRVDGRRLEDDPDVGSDFPQLQGERPEDGLLLVSATVQEPEGAVENSADAGLLLHPADLLHDHLPRSPERLGAVVGRGLTGDLVDRKAAFARADGLPKRVALGPTRPEEVPHESVVLTSLLLRGGRREGSEENGDLEEEDHGHGARVRPAPRDDAPLALRGRPRGVENGVDAGERARNHDDRRREGGREEGTRSGRSQRVGHRKRESAG